MKDEVKIYYDMYPENGPVFDEQELKREPEPGKYLVTIGAKGVNSVHLIQDVRIVKALKPRDFVRYSLTLQRQPDLKDFTEYEYRWASLKAWVRGEAAYPCVWHRRDKKKKR